MLQALSDRDVPIATIKVTYVVERGNLYDVATDINMAAITRFKLALNLSNDGLVPSIDFAILSFELNLKDRLILCKILSGIILNLTKRKINY